MTRLLAVCALLLLAGCGQDGLDQLKVGETGQVARVRSGDTLELKDGLVVRLAGIDAPDASQPYAETARLALARLVLGREVQLLYGGERRDRHGRAIAQVRIVKGRAWVQQRLLRDGAARVRTYPDSAPLATRLLNEEARARLNAKGLWREPRYRVLLPVEVGRARGLTLIEGRVTDVTTDAYGQTLVMDKVLRIPIEGMQVRAMALAGLEPVSLKGKLVRLRANIPRNGRIQISDREQIEILRDKP